MRITTGADTNVTSVKQYKSSYPLSNNKHSFNIRCDKKAAEKGNSHHLCFHVERSEGAAPWERSAQPRSNLVQVGGCEV